MIIIEHIQHIPHILLFSFKKKKTKIDRNFSYYKLIIINFQSRDQSRENNRVWFAHAVKMDVHLSKFNQFLFLFPTMVQKYFLY